MTVHLVDPDDDKTLCCRKSISGIGFSQVYSVTGQDRFTSNYTKADCRPPLSSQQMTKRWRELSNQLIAIGNSTREQRTEGM